MGFLISQGDDIGMHSIALIVDIELCPNNAYVGDLACCSNPKFHPLFLWSVDDELSSVVVVVGLRLNAANIGAMVELSEAKASNIFQVGGRSDVFFVSFCSQVKDGFHVEKVVDTILDREAKVEDHKTGRNEAYDVGILQVVIVVEVKFLFAFEHLLSGLFSHFCSA